MAGVYTPAGTQPNEFASACRGEEPGGGRSAAKLHRVEVEDIPVGVLEPHQLHAAHVVHAVREGADIGIVLERRAGGPERGDDRVDLVPHAPHHRVGAVVAGLGGGIDHQPRRAGAVGQHPLLPAAALIELEPEDAAVERPRALEIGHGDDGGRVVVFEHVHRVS